MQQDICEKIGEKHSIDCDFCQQLEVAVSSLPYFPVLLCIGSDKITGDALAPIVGSILCQMQTKCICYGTLAHPVNAKNLSATTEYIAKMHSGQKVLVVDASVGAKEDLGKVRFLQCGISPGKAVGKCFPTIGDFSIAGIVAYRNIQTQSISQSRLFDVVEMAKSIARQISLVARGK